MPDDLDIVLPRSTSLNGVRPGCTIRDMFGPGHSPLVSGAFFMNMVLNRHNFARSEIGRASARPEGVRARDGAHQGAKKNSFIPA